SASVLVRLTASPCIRRVAALGPNHSLSYPGDRLPDECADRSVARPAGALQLGSRKDPVCAFGVARGPAPVSDPLRYDYSCAAGGAAAHLRPGRGGFTG